MEAMKGEQWSQLVRKEQSLTRDAVQSVAPLVKVIENEFIDHAKKEKNHRFSYYNYQIRAANTLHYEWSYDLSESIHGCADLDATSEGIWYVEDVGEGAEVYKLKHNRKGSNSWIYDTPVGPFVAVLDDRVYSIESQHDLWYCRLISLDAATGKDRRIIFEMEDPRWNLALIKGQNKCLFMLGNNAGQQRLWCLNGSFNEIGMDYESFLPVGFHTNKLHFFGRRAGSKKFEAIGSELPHPKEDNSPEYYSLLHKIYVTRSYGKRTIHYKDGQERIVIGEVKPNLFLDWIGSSQAKDLEIHESGGAFHWAKSKDGTRVPYVLIGWNGKKIHGLLVIGYGAYGLPTKLDIHRWQPLLRRGFAICFALVRGGGDHDDAWAEAARRDNKVKSVEDFESVIKSASHTTYIPAERVAIYGRSAGGYLVGSTLSRNADGTLFGCLYTEVPYLDVLRTTSNPKLPLTQLEYNEFGDPIHRKKDAAALLRLSPIETIPEGGAPSIFVLCRTGLNDKEVFAYESVKWITKLKEYQGVLGKPKLLAIAEGEGHFVSGRSLIRERAEDLALLISELARSFPESHIKKSKHRIYKMVLSRKNRKNSLKNRKDRKNVSVSRKDRKNVSVSRKNRKDRKDRKESRKNRKDRKDRKNRKESRKNRKANM